MQEEIWKIYRDHEDGRKLTKIEVSNKGNIKLNGKLKKFKLSNKQLYYTVCHMYVHRLVAELFIPNPENKPEIDHIDTNKLNNDANNLRWVTRKENLNNPITLIHYSYSNKFKRQGEKEVNEKRSASMKATYREIKKNGKT